jgi:thioredoxin 1
MTNVIQVTTSDFASVVETTDMPVIVDFAASWCGPCKALAPTFEAVASELADKAKFVKVDIDDAPEIAQQYGIRGVPTLVIVKGGKAVASKTGNQSKAALTAFIESNL